ncbi:MAG: thiol-disulfide oxidoreductase DCC family protein [Candidatus Hydrogenedentes bacterium]|nr:thiol-disulfide oxidoreductase DCC family protein [Candidatus Hydrogenedentota bacterium]
MEHPVLLFDGVCNLCNKAVQFIIKRDKDALFRFASLQSDAGQALLNQHDLPTEDFDTMVYLEGDSVYTRSTAGLRIARRLGGLWPLLYAFIVIPRPIRDAVYGVIVRNRYRWFGKRDDCMVPTPDLRARFLE